MQVLMLADVFDAGRILLAKGSTQDLADAVALDLIGTGRAQRVTPLVSDPATLTKEEVEAVRDGGVGAGGASGLSFGSDPTAAGPGGTPYTVTGLPWAMTYNPDGSEASRTITLVGASSLVRTASYVDGNPTYSGNIEIDGATVMTASQLQYLYSERLIALGTAARGARFRVEGTVDADFIAYTISTGGTRRNLSCVLEWDGARLVPVSGVALESWHNTQHTNSAVESAALSTSVLPRWLNKAGARWNIYTVQTGAGGTANTVRAIIKVNGSPLVNPNSSSAAAVTQALEMDINCDTDASQFTMPSAASGTGRTGAMGAAYQTLAIDSSTTDMTVTTHTQMGAAESGRTVTHRLTRIEMVS